MEFFLEILWKVKIKILKLRNENQDEDSLPEEEDDVVPEEEESSVLEEEEGGVPREEEDGDLLAWHNCCIPASFTVSCAGLVVGFLFCLTQCSRINS